MTKKRRRNHAIKRLPAGHAAGSKPQNITARPHHARNSYCPDVAELEHDTDPRTALWRAVFAQAIMDAKSKSNKQEYEYIRHTALHWLLEEKSDFSMVCELAGFDPEHMRQRIRTAHTRGFVWRAGDAPQRESDADPFSINLGTGQSHSARISAKHRRFAKRWAQLEFVF